MSQLYSHAAVPTRRRLIREASGRLHSCVQVNTDLICSSRANNVTERPPKQRDKDARQKNRKARKTGQISRQSASNEAYNNPQWHSNKQPSIGNTPVVCDAPKTTPRQEITMTMNEIRSACGHTTPVLIFFVRTSRPSRNVFSVSYHDRCHFCHCAAYSGKPGVTRRPEGSFRFIIEHWVNTDFLNVAISKNTSFYSSRAALTLLILWTRKFRW